MRTRTLLGTLAIATVLAMATAGGPASADDNKQENKQDKQENKQDKQENKQENNEKRDQKDQEKDARKAEKEREHQDKKACSADWSSASAGRPSTLRNGSAAGLYVWHDGSKWNVEATHPGTQVAVFQGTITFDTPVQVESRHLERGSDTYQSAGNQVSFTFKNYGGADGLRLRSTCATSVTVAGTLNGQPLTAQQYFVGKSSAPSSAVPFVERRVITAPVPQPVPTVAPCVVPAWNSAYQAKPGNLREGAAAGLYIWFDGDRLFVETTRPNQTRSIITGSVVANAAVSAVNGVATDSGDVISAQTNGATFSFTNTGGIDGLELRSPCATQVIITATIDGQPLAPQQVWIGRGSLTPGVVPVTLAR